MNYLRKYRNRRICKIELVSALDKQSFLISPPDGFTDASIPVEYSGVYFTISSVELTQKPKTTAAGIIYVISLDFSFPNFPDSHIFQLHFSRLSEIRLALSTGGVIRLNKNDIALNRAIDVEFSGNLKTVKFSAQIQTINPLNIGEQ